MVIAEWQKQRAVLMSFPHKNSDWGNNLQKALVPFIRIAQAIAYSTPVYIICHNKDDISNLFCNTRNMSFIEIDTNDTWIRDYGYISVVEDGENKLLDFEFNAWGNKFKSNLDNMVNQKLYKKGYMGTTPLKSIDFVLEGGSIESDGVDTIMTTTKCLCNSNRNGGLSKMEVESRLKEYLGTKRVLWLNYGYLAGDDTDSHIDTIARFVSSDTIVYIKCEDVDDEHYDELNLMQKELQEFRQSNGKKYNLISLPMTTPKYNINGDRLPATYANFLITNGAIIVPSYDDINDKKAQDILREIFPKKEIIPVNCLTLIEEGGSLHCSTMNIA
ncbi:Agmatine deiminase [hydrothermal vent metagenome]|uniref:Agmatine deiminase n=1 Tax=hydrothermal vent metagenome TaxID=652676 RepID=A0A1W1EI76_9ZZZZ